ncbi:MAG TPA: phosphotransferase [Acidimicrobiales bacterium]|nr:phosphotransferase [Acidimicrobiales bacterium]
MPARPTSGLVHGMNTSLVEADWPALTDDEVRAVLRHFDRYEGVGATRVSLVSWRSPRPMSAAALVHFANETVFVKRHHVAVRTPERLRVEHEFSSYLRARGQALPAVLRCANGDTVVQDGDFVYEVHEMVTGVDLYRDVPSWCPFTSLDHARAAGRALARFHRAAKDFSLPPSVPGVLVNSTAIVVAADPLAELDRLIACRPGMARAVAQRSFIKDFTRYHLLAIEKAAPLLSALSSQWGHGDWHASNLTWSSTSPTAIVEGVFDLGLSNRTFAVHDLALALERSTVDWLGLARTGNIRADLGAVDALLDGYEEVQPLSDVEWVALIAVLPIVHLEYALSEVEYFAEVVRSPVNADLAYDGYYIGHSRWFEEAAGFVLLEHLRRRAERY